MIFMSEAPLEIQCRDVKQLQDANADVVLIDCREPNEVAISAIAAARLIPMDEFPGRLAELTGHEADQIVVYCHLGGRSLRVARWLRQQGFARAQSMAGGIDQWAEQIEPGMARY
jgi:adenylyltransferase/sulfurtransferase